MAEREWLMSNVFNKLDTDPREELIAILKKMDIPWRRRELSRNNLRWLNRNIAVRNSEHPDFDTARELITRLLRRK
tara:strand:- start:1829 stop:2056 length:228 start_codon:yes stop_codon:yes gene_type:complete